MTRSVLAAALASALMVSPSMAHRLDEYAQVAAISVTSDTVTIELRLTPGQLVANDVLALIDIDSDEGISWSEQDKYITKVLGDLTLTLDGLVQWPVVASYVYPDERSIREGVGIIAITLKTTVQDDGDHKLNLVNRHMSGMAVYLVNALVPNNASIAIGEQSRSPDQSAYELTWSSVNLPAESDSDN